MSGLVNRVQALLLAWLKIIERAPGLVLGILIILGLVAGGYASLYGRINSDLSSLVKPSASLAWYQDNENYKASFPEFDQTAVIAVSGHQSHAVEQIATQLRDELTTSGLFEFVFAPAIDPFITTHKLYFLDKEDLQGFLRGVEYSYGSNLRLADEAGIVNGIYTLADHISANRGLPLPSPLSSLISLSKTDGVQLQSFPPLIDTSQSEHYQLIIVKGKQNIDQRLPNETIVTNLRDIVSQVGVPDTIQVRLTGEVPLAHEEISAALNGIGIAGTISVFILFAILWFGIRSWRIIAAIFAMLAIGVLLTMAFATLTIGSYNTLSLMFIVMFFGLGVDFAVHFALRVDELAAKRGIGEAVELAVTDIGPALLLCMLTSMIAFLSFTPTAYRGLAELGVMSASGMMIAFLLSITLLPAIFLKLGIGSRPRQNLIGQDQLQTNEKALITSLITGIKPVYIVICFLLLATLAAILTRDMRFDYSVLAMRDAKTEGMKTLLDLQRNNMTTDYSIAVIARGPKEAIALKAKLEALPEVGDVATPLDYVPKDQLTRQEKLLAVLNLYESIDEVLSVEADAEETRAALDDAIAYLSERMPLLPVDQQEKLSVFIGQVRALQASDQALISINDAMFESLTASLAMLRQLLGAESFTLDDIPEDLRHRVMNDRGQYLLTVQPAMALDSRQATEDFILAVEQVAPNIAGRSVVEWGVGDVVVESFQFAVSLSFVCIFILLILYFRSLILPILVLIPIALALLFTFAVCQLTGLTLNMANILVVPLIIGLGVDTGIHVVHRSLDHKDVTLVFRSSTAKAVLISAATTIGTFFSLSFSPHQGAASVGLLLTVAISLLVMITFILLPALLSLFNQPNPILATRIET